MRFFFQFSRFLALYAIPLNDFTPRRIHVGAISKRFTLKELNPRSFPNNLYTVQLLVKLINQKRWCRLSSIVQLMVKIQIEIFVSPHWKYQVCLKWQLFVIFCLYITNCSYLERNIVILKLACSLTNVTYLQLVAKLLVIVYLVI